MKSTSDVTTSTGERVDDVVWVRAFGRWWLVPGAFVTFGDDASANVSWIAQYAESDTKLQHGRVITYRHGCRCFECKDARAAENRRAYLKRTGRG